MDMVIGTTPHISDTNSGAIASDLCTPEIGSAIDRKHIIIIYTVGTLGKNPSCELVV